MEEIEDIYENSIKYQEIADSVLALCLMHIFKDDIDDKLPTPSGHTMDEELKNYTTRNLNEKSRMVHKFIVEQCGTPEKFEGFLNKIALKIKD